MTPLPTLHGERVTLRPLTDADLPQLAAFVAHPSVRAWWDDPSAGEHPVYGLDDDGEAFAIELGGVLAGWLGFEEETDPGYRHVGLDILLGPGFQDRGLGSEALRAAIGWLVEERAHHRFTIDPALDNARAIRAYEAIGFRRVGVMRRYERAPDGVWRDSLLMDLLAEELVASAQRDGA